MPKQQQQNHQASGERAPRVFKTEVAVRKKVPVWFGIATPSGAGKTKSMLRTLTGMVSITGGKAGVIDTENNRALSYAPNPGDKADPAKGTYDFVHLPMAPPFDSLSYL